MGNACCKKDINDFQNTEHIPFSQISDAPKEFIHIIDDAPPLPPPPVSFLDKKIRVKAIYDFEGQSYNGELSFNKLDLLEVEDDSVFEGEVSWVEATHLGTGQVGYIPSNYITRDDDAPESQDWWFNIVRKEADKLLLLPGNEKGTFLVRYGSDKNYAYVLSVRDLDKKTDEPSVRHYKIAVENDRYRINPKIYFDDVLQLIEFYKRDQGNSGLCCCLTKPLPRERPQVTFRDLEVNRNLVKLTVKLGHGNFGEVWKGKLRSVVDCAVKQLRPGSMSSAEFLEEAKIMHKLTHPKLVQLLAVVSEQEPFYIITELMANGSLLDYLRSNDGKKLSVEQLIYMNAEISEGMSYLERKNFVHRDLRAANILVGEHCNVKVADFGLSRVLDDEIYEASQNTKFPVKWTAPEAAEERRFTVKSDVWSFGILMFEIITYGMTPYPGMHNNEVLQKLSTGWRMSKPNGQFVIENSYYEMMLKCWHRTPEERPTFEFLNSYFNDYGTCNEEQYLGQ